MKIGYITTIWDKVWDITAPVSGWCCTSGGAVDEEGRHDRAYWAKLAEAP